MLEFCVVAFISTLGAFVFSDVIMNFLRWLTWILGYHLEQGDRVLVSRSWFRYRFSCFKS